MEKIIEAIAKAKSNAPQRPRRMVNFSSARAQTSDFDESILLRFDSVVLDKSHLENNRIIAFVPSDPKSGSYDMLRTQLLQKMSENNWQKLIVTSPTAGCGKTVTAINLAFSMARQAGQVVVLVDLDLRKPDIGNCLGITPERSLFNVFQDRVEVADTLVRVDGSGMMVLANDEPIRNASEVIASQKISELVGDLCALFPKGIFIFDLPPMLVTDDVIAFFPQADCTLLLVAAGQTTLSQIESCESHLQLTNFLGIALNKIEGAAEPYY